MFRKNGLLKSYFKSFIQNSFSRKYFSERKFRVLGLQQIAIGGLDKEKLVHLWSNVLGVPKIGSFKSESENVEEDVLQVGVGISAVEIDLMQPLDNNRSPKVHVPALNHIGLWVDDLGAAVATLTEQGMRFTPGGIRKGAAGHDVIFIHPKLPPTSTEFEQNKNSSSNTSSSSSLYRLCGEGVLIELVQAPPELIAVYNSGSGNSVP